jgi:hypothetical protein
MSACVQLFNQLLGMYLRFVSFRFQVMSVVPWMCRRLCALLSRLFIRFFPFSWKMKSQAMIESFLGICCIFFVLEAGRHWSAHGRIVRA